MKKHGGWSILFTVGILLGLLSGCSDPTMENKNSATATNHKSLSAIVTEDVILGDNPALFYLGALYNRATMLYMSEHQATTLRQIGETGNAVVNPQTDWESTDLASGLPVYEYRNSLLLWCGHHTALALQKEILEDQTASLLFWGGHWYAGESHTFSINTLQEENKLGYTSRAQNGGVPFLSLQTSVLPAGCPIYLTQYGLFVVTSPDTNKNKGRIYNETAPGQIADYVQENLMAPAIFDAEPLLFYDGHLYHASAKRTYSEKDIAALTPSGYTTEPTIDRVKPVYDWEPRGIVPSTPVYILGNDLLVWDSGSAYRLFVKS